MNLSVKLLFYVTVSILLDQYGELLKRKQGADFGQFDIDQITDAVRKCFKNYVELETKRDFSDCKIVLHTALKNTDRDLIYHIVKFVHVYYIYSRFGNYNLVKDPLKNIVTKIQAGIHPNQILVLSEEKERLIADIVQNKEKYYEQITIKRSGKILYCQ